MKKIIVALIIIIIVGIGVLLSPKEHKKHIMIGEQPITIKVKMSNHEVDKIEFIPDNKNVQIEQLSLNYHVKSSQEVFVEYDLDLYVNGEKNYHNGTEIVIIK